MFSIYNESHLKDFVAINLVILQNTKTNVYCISLFLYILSLKKGLVLYLSERESPLSIDIRYVKSGYHWLIVFPIKEVENVKGVYQADRQRVVRK